MRENGRASGGRLWAGALGALVLCGCAETVQPKCGHVASMRPRCPGNARDAAIRHEDGGVAGGAGAASPPSTGADARVNEAIDASSAGAQAAGGAGADAAADAGPPPFVPCDEDGVRLCSLEFLPPLPFPMQLDRLEPLDVSADGSTIVGTAWDSEFEASIVGAQYHAWVWTLETRTTMLPSDPGGRPGDRAAAVAVSATGAPVLWQRAQGFAVRWFGVEHASELPFVDASDISDDGSVVVGNERTHAIRWTAAEGVELLGDLEEPPCDLICLPTSRARAVSGDGLVVVGESARKPFRWSRDGGMQAIPLRGLDTMIGIATAANRDGTVVAGCTRRSTAQPPDRLWRFTDDQGAVDLGELPGEGQTRCDVALDADGSVVVGSSHGHAFLWEAASGMRALAEVLAEAGIDVADWAFEHAGGISADGKVIAGTARFMDRPVAFVARLP